MMTFPDPLDRVLSKYHKQSSRLYRRIAQQCDEPKAHRIYIDTPSHSVGGVQARIGVAYDPKTGYTRWNGSGRLHTAFSEAKTRRMGTMMFSKGSDESSILATEEGTDLMD